jgi:DnaJ-class molecular chaperone
MRQNQDVTINVRITLNDVMTGKDIIGRYRLSTGREEIANIRVPAGVENGLIMQYRGLGDDAVNQLPRGNLNVRIIVENHPNFVRDRLHIRTNCSINVLALILGTQVIVTDLAGKDVNVKIPAGTNPGTILSIAGHGLPDVNTGKLGNLYLEIKGNTPKIDDWDMLEDVRKIYNGTNTST